MYTHHDACYLELDDSMICDNSASHWGQVFVDQALTDLVELCIYLMQ